MTTDVDIEDLANVAKDTVIPDSRPPMNPRPNMLGLDQSYSNQNQWFCYCPIEDILGKRYKNLDLHLTRFSLPQIEIATSTVSYKGYEKEIPMHVLNSSSKQLTLEYIVDEYWQNYKALYAWAGGGTGVINPISDDKPNGISPSEYITLRVYLMNNYKKKILQFEFYNCFIKVFNDIALDYSSTDNVTHSFTFCYDDMRLVEI